MSESAPRVRPVNAPGSGDRQGPALEGRGPLRIALYGEINMNLIDGSSVWLQAVAQTLDHACRGWRSRCRFASARSATCSPPRSRPPAHRVARSRPRPSDRALGAAEAVDCLERPRRRVPIRSGPPAGKEGERRGLSPPGLPRAPLGLLPAATRAPAGRGGGAPAADRAGVGAHPLSDRADQGARPRPPPPRTRQELILLPPMIPSPRGPSPQGERAGPLKLIYAGKFAPEYYFLEMVETFRRLRRSHPEAELHLVGDKVHNPPDDPGFKVAAERGPGRDREPDLAWGREPRAGRRAAPRGRCRPLDPAPDDGQGARDQAARVRGRGLRRRAQPDPDLRRAPRPGLSAVRDRPGRGSDGAARVSPSDPDPPRRGGRALRRGPAENTASSA